MQTYGDWNYQNQPFVMPSDTPEPVSSNRQNEKAHEDELLKEAEKTAAAAPAVEKEVRKKRAGMAASQRIKDDIYNIKGLDGKWIDRETRIQVATVQSMVKRILYNDEKTMPAVSDFDLIIIDEAHRGYLLDKEMGEDEVLYRCCQPHYHVCAALGRSGSAGR